MAKDFEGILGSVKLPKVLDYIISLDYLHILLLSESVRVILYQMHHVSYFGF